MRPKPDPPDLGREWGEARGGPLMFNQAGSSRGARVAVSLAQHPAPNPRVSARPRSGAHLGSAPGPSQERSREPGSETAGAGGALPRRAAPTRDPSPAHGRCAPPQGIGRAGPRANPGVPAWAQTSPLPAMGAGRAGGSVGCCCCGSAPRSSSTGAGESSHAAQRAATASFHLPRLGALPEWEADANPQRDLCGYRPLSGLSFPA